MCRVSCCDLRVCTTQAMNLWVYIGGSWEEKQLFLSEGLNKHIV